MFLEVARDMLCEVHGVVLGVRITAALTVQAIEALRFCELYLISCILRVPNVRIRTLTLCTELNQRVITSVLSPS